MCFVIKHEKIRLKLKKVGKIFGDFIFSPYLCTRNQAIFRLQRKLGYGVMVTLQILVLPFLVRVRVSQQRRAQSFKKVALFLFKKRKHETGSPEEKSWSALSD